MSSLVFVDTNIYLDFYRVRGGDASLSILRHFDGNHDRIITTDEVEMEYKKNRQKVIIESLKLIKPQNSGGLVVPAFLRESQMNKTIRRTREQLSKQTDRLMDRTARLLESPSRNDPVYRVLQRLFKARADCHLHRGNKKRQDIRELARKRLMLGYPPRKKTDLDLGDAINWEWIIYCAQNCTDDIVIVSRDSDYGVYYRNKAIINDWLLQEFKERVSHKRSITLTTRLTEGFKLASITVSKEEEMSEEKFIELLKTIRVKLEDTEIVSEIKSSMKRFLSETEEDK
jgi:hypothetical protein